MVRDYAFIDRKYAYEYPRAAHVTDAVVFRFDGQRLYLLLVERGADPEKGHWALPGGFLNMDETVEQCCRRELEEETGLTDAYMKQIGTFSDIERDPRGRVLSTAYYALVKPETEVTAGDDAARAQWFPLRDVLMANRPDLMQEEDFSVIGGSHTRHPLLLAFDHARILRTAVQRLREDMYFRPVAFELLPSAFTQPQLQRLYEEILGKSFDRRNFARKMIAEGILVPTGEKEVSHTHRCGNLYRFDITAYTAMKKEDQTSIEF